MFKKSLIVLLVATVAVAAEVAPEVLSKRLDAIEAQIERKQAELAKLEEQRAELRVKLGLEGPKAQEGEQEEVVRSMKEIYGAIPASMLKKYPGDAESNAIGQWLNSKFAGKPMEIETGIAALDTVRGTDDSATVDAVLERVQGKAGAVGIEIFPRAGLVGTKGELDGLNAAIALKRKVTLAGKIARITAQPDGGRVKLFVSFAECEIK